ncbi:MAG: hypothetical protein DMD89_07830 [Candidatus Rokuibacteriota bacterium]|nr:MAG: hypothetical protein DMD89_07830 [Candidatus Rokubacteria bacterium]
MDREAVLVTRGGQEEGGAGPLPQDHDLRLPRPRSGQGSGDRRRPRPGRHLALRARPRIPGLRGLSHAGCERSSGRRALREVPRPRSAAQAGGEPRAVAGRRRGGSGRDRGPARDPSRLHALLVGLQHPHQVGLPGRLHHGPHAARQAGGLRGLDPSGPRRLALNALLAVLLGAVLAVAPATVAAHSLLLEASPAADALLPEPPTEIALRFNNRVEKRLCTILLVDGHGEARRAEIRADGPADRLNAAAPALGAGTWRLEWRVLSTDGHVVTGRYSFRVAP